MADDNFQATQQAMLLGGMYGPNKYSHFPNGIVLPGYVGGPTDAQGRPIQPPPGTTLNQTAQAAPPAALTPQPQPTSEQLAMAGPMNSMGALLGMLGEPGYKQAYDATARSAAPQPQAAAPAADNSLNNAISLLANPGKVTTPGATAPQYQIGNQPSVLQQFLANQKGGQGAGNYSNAGFFSTLNDLGKTT